MAKTVYFGLSLSAFKEKLKEKTGGAYILYGEEELLKKFYLDKITAIIEKEGFSDFNLTRLDFSRKNTLGDLEDEIGVMPVMASHRLIIVYGLDILKLSGEDSKRLIKLLSDIPEYLYLVIYQNENEFLPDRETQKKAIIKNLSEKASFVPFPLQNEKTLFSWCQKIAGAEKLSVAPDAFRLLYTLTEGRMISMKAELDKLIMYALSKEKGEITAADVELFVEGNPEFELFRLSDAVMIGDKSAAINILNSMKRHKSEPVVIIASLSRTVVGALFAINGADYSDAKKGAGLSDWQLDNMRKKVYGKKKENIEKALCCCVEADKKIKSTRIPPFLICENLALEIAGLMK